VDAAGVRECSIVVLCPEVLRIKIELADVVAERWWWGDVVGGG